MNMKKLFAALLAVALMLGCLPFAASAANVPTTLYVGEKDKAGDNLIDKYDTEGNVLVYAIDTNTQAYYTVTKEDGVGYVLTFYNDYTMSEMVTDASAYCGVYCDGDLTIRLAGNIKFNANDAKKKNAIGWYVEGVLTIERATENEKGKAFTTPPAANLYVCGSKAKSSSDSGSIGVSAQTLMLHNVSVFACGGYAGVKAEEAIVMLDSYLYANTDADMKEDDTTLFKYSVQTDHFIQSGGAIRAVGDVKIESYWFDGGVHVFDEKVVVYARSYEFAQTQYAGIWGDSFDLFKNPDAIPTCMRVVLGSSVAKIDGNDLKLNRRGGTTLQLLIKCGSGTIAMCKPCAVSCSVVWWQWIPYILSGAWIGALTD